MTIGNRTSTFDGLIGMLERGEIDVALADLSLTPARAQVIVLLVFKQLHYRIYKQCLLQLLKTFTNPKPKRFLNNIFSDQF